MKKILLMFLGCIIFASCGKQIPNKTISHEGNGVYNYRIDSCDYIGYLKSTQADWASHSGNCKNPRHTAKQDSIISMLKLLSIKIDSLGQHIKNKK